MKMTLYRNKFWCNGIGYQATNFGDGGWLITVSLLFWTLSINTFSNWHLDED